MRRLGRTRYLDAHRLQQELVERRLRGEIGDTLLLTEHEPVITVGRGVDRADLSTATLPIVDVERGGEATYHGPGQLVGYPIVLLEPGRRDLHRYLRDLEEVVIGVLADVGLDGERKSGFTGVWVGGRKIASIGVAVRRWVAWHGFALNVDNDPRAFLGFKPCGLESNVMTRVADLVPGPHALARFEDATIARFAAVFGMTVSR